MVVEADESDGSFVKLPATIAVVTNMDPEHLDYYSDFDEIRDAFLSFLENIPFYGAAVMCIDHPEVQALMGRITDRRVISYGFSPQADVQARNLSFEGGSAHFDVALRDRRSGSESGITGLVLPMPGHHNVLNSLAAIAVARELGASDELIRDGLAAFAGVKRRFTRTGEAGGITVIDDYGHHPVEIDAVLKAARNATTGRVIAVAQPHRYTRLAALFEDFCTCFNDADTVIVADVFPAGEQPIEGADKAGLVAGLRQRGHRDVHALSAPEDLARTVAEVARPGDLVVCLGAGSISLWANALPEALRALQGGGQ